MPTLRYIELGRCGYAEALALQQRLLAEAIATEGPPERLLLVEHDPPVITLGKSASEANVLASAERLAALDMRTHPITRGGDVTLHARGQLVGYPILPLARHGRDIRRYVRDIEEVLLHLLSRFDIAAFRREGLTGVWTDAGKAAAIGVAVKRWVSYHGFALNVCNDLSLYDVIVPCGLADRRVTSMTELLGRGVTVDEVKPPLLKCMAEVFGFEDVREERLADG